MAWASNTCHTPFHESLKPIDLPAQGPLKFYTGFPTYCIRCAPYCMHTVLARLPMSSVQACMHACPIVITCVIRYQAHHMHDQANRSSRAFHEHSLLMCCRIAPHVTLTLVFLDALKTLQAKSGL